MNPKIESKNELSYSYEVYDSFKNDMVFRGSTQEVADYINCTPANIHIASKKGTLIGKRYMVQLLGERKECSINTNSKPSKEPKRYDVFKGNSLLYTNQTVKEICDKTGLVNSTIYRMINDRVKSRDGYTCKPTREWVGLEEKAPVIDDTPFGVLPTFVTTEVNKQDNIKTEVETNVEIKNEVEIKTNSTGVITNLDKYIDIIHSAMRATPDIKIPTFSEMKEFKDWLLSAYHNPILLKSWEKEMLECYVSITPFINEQVLMQMKSKGNFSGVDNVLMSIGEILSNCEVQE